MSKKENWFVSLLKAISDFFTEFSKSDVKPPKIEEPKTEPAAEPVEYTVHKTPRYGEQGEHVKTLQKVLNIKGVYTKVDGDFGPKTRASVSRFQKSMGSAGSGVIGPKTMRWLGLKLKPVKKRRIPWFWKAKEYEGQHETNPAFNKEMTSKWTLVGLNLPHITASWTAWCGLFVAVALAGVGYQWQKDGATAKNWDKFGQTINWRVNGFPQGAIIRINHRGKCNSASGNHVTFANGWCSARDLTRKGATFSGYGGNQGNKAKVSTYPVWKICSVKWPKEESLPGKVLQSKNCSNGKTSTGESTR